MNFEEYNGDNGPTVYEKMLSIVDVRTRHQSPPVVDITGVFCTLSHSHVTDPRADPNLVLDLACSHGDLVRIDDPPGRDRPVLGLPTPETFRYALGGEPDLGTVQKRIRKEADSDGRHTYIGAMNGLLDLIRAETIQSH